MLATLRTGQFICSYVSDLFECLVRVGIRTMVESMNLEYVSL